MDPTRIQFHPVSGYQKFCYWLNRQELEEIGASVGKKDFHRLEETRIPCRVLRSSLEFGLVPPTGWEGFCRRRTSWYGTSEKAGKFLAVSKRPLNSLGFPEVIRILESDFKPERIPTLDQIHGLARSLASQKRKPTMWDKIDPVEREFHKRWFERSGSKAPFDFEEVSTFHSANHANFLDARFFVTVERGVAPYSIGDSLHTCSSCLEFFNILGDQWPLKYVIPCLGAVQFARLPQDRYFCVVTERGSTEGGNTESKGRRTGING